MTIPTITPYAGGVANPDGSQTQSEFTQNMFDQLSYEAQLASELNATVNATNQTASEVDSNAAIAQSSADTAQAAANFEGEFAVGVTSAEKGKSYSYNGEVWLCLQNTTSTPSTGNVAWKLSVGEQYVKEAEERSLSFKASLFKGSDGVRVKIGDVIPTSTTHLLVLIDGDVETVEMTEQVAGSVTSINETSATIGGTTVGLIRTDGSIFCVVRQSSQGSGWDYIDDSTHKPKGFSQPITVDEVTRNLVIPVDGLRSKVGAISVTPDETYAKKVTVGASVAINSIYLKIFAPLTIGLNIDTLAVSVSDFQDVNDISVSKVDGVLTVTHPSNAVVSANTDDRRIDSTDGRQYVISSRNAVQTVIEEVRSWCCNVFWDGSSWVVLSNLKSEPTIIPSGGGFQVVHGLPGFNLPQVSMNLNNGYQALIGGSNGGTSFYVRFRDGSGNEVTTPDTNMNVIISMPIMAKQNSITGGGQLYIGMVQVHPDNIFGGTSNFWINGSIR